MNSIRVYFAGTELAASFIRPEAEVLAINPYTGEMDTLENIINYIADAGKTDSLTATEYDALALTATAYDAYDLTAYQYDWEGKSLLV